MSPNLTRRSVLGLGALSAVGALSACSATSSGNSTSGSTTVTVMYASSEFSKDQISAFEKANPDLKVTFIEFDQTRLNAMLTAGDPPDFVRGAPSSNLFARGLAAPIDSYLAKSKVIATSDLLAINDNWRWDGAKTGAGARYGLVKDWSQDASIWQNTKVFEAAGVEPLSTTEAASWDELLEKAKQLKAKKVKYGLGVEWAWGLTAPIFTMILQQGGTVYNDDLSQVDFTSTQAQRAVQWFVDFGTSGAGPSSLNPLADGSDNGVFAAGDMAASLDGYWFGGNFQDDASADLRKHLAMAPAPTFGTRVNPSFNGGVGAWIPTKAKHKDAGWRVMEYFIAGQPAIDRATSGWGLPSLKSRWSDLPTTYDFQKQAIATTNDELKYLVTLPNSPYIQSTAWDQAVSAQITAVLKGQKSTAQACASIESTVNGLLAQGKDQIG